MSLLVIIDIDGTIADASRRFEVAGKDPGPSDQVKHDQWIAKVQNEEMILSDPAVPGMREMIHAMGCMGLVEIIYLTGREDQFRTVTEKWLAMHKFPSHLLEMRIAGDRTRNCDFKEIVINRLKYIYKADNVVVLDDDQRGELEKVCTKNKWTFLKARSGGIE